MKNLQDIVLVNEHPDNLNFQHNIIKTAQKYFNCDYINFEFKEDVAFFNLPLSILSICIETSKDNKSWGYISYGSYVREFESENNTFEDTCRNIHSFVKEHLKSIKEDLIGV